MSTKNRNNETSMIVRAFDKIMACVIEEGWTPELQQKCWNLQQKFDWEEALPEIQEHYGVSDKTLSQCKNWEQAVEERSDRWMIAYELQQHAEDEEDREEELQLARENGYEKEFLLYEQYSDKNEFGTCPELEWAMSDIRNGYNNGCKITFYRYIYNYI